jgi:thiol-disulfide isomerase/thioredoxin
MQIDKGGIHMMRALYFKSNNCPVCKDFLPKFILICNEYNIPYEIIDLSDNQEKAGQLTVFSVPTIIFLNEENYELIRFSGYFGSYEIKNFLDRYYSTY